ncbi:MAG: hypothetical protein KA365_06650 [Arenimonas sp.]|nr:hypothetical protein [Arenimonas sp.]
MKNQYKRIYAPFEQTQSIGNTQLLGWAEQSDAQITELFFEDSKVVGVRRLTPTLYLSRDIG